MSVVKTQPWRRLLGYPLLAATAACLVVMASAGIIGWYYFFLWPFPLLAAALGVAAAREWNRPAQRAFVGGCIGSMLATLAWIPFQTNPALVLPTMGVGLAVGVGIGLRIRR